MLVNLFAKKRAAKKAKEDLVVMANVDTEVRYGEGFMGVALVGDISMRTMPLLPPPPPP